jgi:hypothetical protein
MRAAWDTLTSLCQNGELGPAEMVLLYGFRNEDGDIDSGM